MSWDLDLGEASWFLDQPVCPLRGAHARWLSQWVESWRWTNCQHRKIVSLSRVENLNLKKVRKVSYLNQESRQCFVFFGFPMYISHIHILVVFLALCYSYLHTNIGLQISISNIDNLKTFLCFQVYLSHTIQYIVSCNYIYFIIIFHLPQFLSFQTNENNL